MPTEAVTGTKGAAEEKAKADAAKKPDGRTREAKVAKAKEERYLKTVAAAKAYLEHIDPELVDACKTVEDVYALAKKVERAMPDPQELADHSGDGFGQQVDADGSITITSTETTNEPPTIPERP
jgi:hypothetical protein